MTTTAKKATMLSERMVEALQFVFSGKQDAIGSFHGISLITLRALKRRKLIVHVEHRNGRKEWRYTRKGELELQRRGRRNTGVPSRSG